MMKFVLLAVLSVFSCSPKEQTTPFEQAINQLVFDVDFMDSTSQLIGSLKSREELTYEPPTVSQWNLDVTMPMGSEQAWSSRHKYSFTKTPLPGYQIMSGNLSVTLGQTSTRSRIIGRSWSVLFETEKDAGAFFDRLKEVFVPLAGKHKAYTDEEGYQVLELSSVQHPEPSIDIIFYLGKSIDSTRYEINLLIPRSINR